MIFLPPISRVPLKLPSSHHLLHISVLWDCTYFLLCTPFLDNLIHSPRFNLHLYVNESNSYSSSHDLTPEPQKHTPNCSGLSSLYAHSHQTSNRHQIEFTTCPPVFLVSEMAPTEQPRPGTPSALTSSLSSPCIRFRYSPSPGSAELSYLILLALQCLLPVPSFHPDSFAIPSLGSS